MNENKNGAPILPDQSAPSASPQDGPAVNKVSIAQNTQVNQDHTGLNQNESASGITAKKKRWEKKHCKILSIDDKVHSMALKFYDEQLVHGWAYTCDMIRATDPKDFQVIAICHDRDLYASDDLFWLPAFEKRHYHVIMRCMDRNKRIRVKQVLRQLGIWYRPVVDAELWKNHGVETVEKFSGYATYLTHETEDAIRDGKELYKLDELVSNLTCEQIQEVRQGYQLVSQDNEKMTTAKWIELDASAYKLGREFGDFDAWYNTLPFTARSGAKIKTIRESYDRGVRDSVDEDPKVLRTCIFIQGAPNKGKTYAVKVAVGLPGRLILCVEGGGSGKFDKLQAYMQAIVISDDVCPNLLNLADDYKCQAYRRNNNNPYWTGKYFIVTSNLSFAEWLSSCGIKVHKKKQGSLGWTDDESEYSDHYKAMETRFFVCHLAENNGKSRLALDSPATRGTFEEQKERLERFMQFQQKFNETIAGYEPGPALDYDPYIDPASLPADRVVKANPAYAFNRLGFFAKCFWNPDFSANSPWHKVKDKKHTDKVEFLHQLSDYDILHAPRYSGDFDLIPKFSVSMIRGMLEEYTREYNVDDFSFEEYILPDSCCI